MKVQITITKSQEEVRIFVKTVQAKGWAFIGKKEEKNNKIFTEFLQKHEKNIPNRKCCLEGYIEIESNISYYTWIKSSRAFYFNKPCGRWSSNISCEMILLSVATEAPVAEVIVGPCAKSGLDSCQVAGWCLKGCWCWDIRGQLKYNEKFDHLWWYWMLSTQKHSLS